MLLEVGRKSRFITGFFENRHNMSLPSVGRISHGSCDDMQGAVLMIYFIIIFSCIESIKNETLILVTFQGLKAANYKFYSEQIHLYHQQFLNLCLPMEKDKSADPNLNDNQCCR